MINIFISVLNMSIVSSYIILVIIIIRFALKKLPKIFSYVLWLIVLIRLTIPFSFSSIFSLFSLNLFHSKSNTAVIESIPKDIGYMVNPKIDTNINTIDNAINNILPAAVEQSSVNPIQTILYICCLVWFVIFTLIIMYSVIRYWKIRNNLKTSILLRDNIFESDKISTAFIFGFIRPKIYVPMNIQENELKYMLVHEYVHLKRFDYIVKPLSFIVASIHWFNPLVWFSLRLMCKDMEMSCDESVLKKMGNGIKGEYSKLLFDISIKNSDLLNCNSIAFGENSVKLRIKNILNYKKPKGIIVLSLISIISILFFVLIANPKSKIIDTKTKVEQTDNYLLTKSEKTPLEVIDIIEKNLKIIMSSPRASSITYDYINAHKNEYQRIVNLVGAYDYLVLQYAKSDTHGLKENIIQYLCKDIIKAKNNMNDEEIVLPDFAVNVKDPIEKLAYDTLIKHYSDREKGFLIASLKIYDVSTEKNKVKIISTVYYTFYKLHGEILNMGESSTIPTAMTYTKNPDGTYTLDEYIESKDGSEFAPSIKEFCKTPISKKYLSNVYEILIDEYGHNEELMKLHKDNLIIHLKTYNLKNIILKGLAGENEKLT